MEVFEIHITGDKSIINNAKLLNLKTIQVELLRPDKSVLRTEYMTSHVSKFINYFDCKEYVDDVVVFLNNIGSNIIRVKIESPYYQHYEYQSIYIESHFDDEFFKHPTSRNINKKTYMATDREYSHDKYNLFRSKWKDVELCLYDSFIEEDSDWFDLY